MSACTAGSGSPAEPGSRGVAETSGGVSELELGTNRESRSERTLAGDYSC